jgi:diguanylate cyclase (GGDEF)-like protein
VVSADKSQTELLLDDIEALRQATIGTKTDSPELRSLLRTIMQRIEDIQATPQVPLAAYNAVTTMLSPLLNAENRLLLQHLSAREDVPPSLAQHVDERRTRLESADYAINAMRSLIERACVLLNASTAPKRDLDTVALCRQFEQGLREHLHDDGVLRQEIGHLIRAMQASVQNINALMQEVEDGPGAVAEIEQILEQELPDDPKLAQALLQKTRQALLATTHKLTHMRGSLHLAMQSQIDSIETLSQRLRHAEEQANKDALTGLANRRQLGQFMSTLKTGPAVLLMVDIDHFKRINDLYGHVAGDKILTAAAGLLASLIRATDIAARFGGEEFCIVMPDIDLMQARDKAEHILKRMAETPFEAEGETISITASIGVAARIPGESIPHWTKRTDSALYKAKQQGRNKVETAD